MLNATAVRAFWPLLLPWLLAAAAAAAAAPPAGPATEGPAELSDAERVLLLRSVQLAQLLGTDEDLAVGLCVQERTPHWPARGPEALQIERWRQDWEHCTLQWHHAGDPLRLVTQATQRMQEQVRRLQRAWEQRAACRAADAAHAANHSTADCLSQAQGRPATPPERAGTLPGRAPAATLAQPPR